MKKHIIPILTVVIFFVLAIGCTKQDNETGTLKVYITDAPFPIEYIESANVLLTKIEARIKSGDGKSEFVTLSDDSLEFNLLELRNGITEKMVDLEIPAGELDLVRIYVEEASLLLTTGESYSVKVPSGAQTGIKVFINPSLTITGGLISELLLDFNLEKSFVLKGNIDTPAGINGFNFKPVIRAVNKSTAGAVSGTVVDTSFTHIPNVSVWVEQDTVVSAAMTDSVGYYAITGLPAGTYDMLAYKESFDTLIIPGVVINAANLTIQNLQLVPEQ